jgi:hypothetical protein
LLKELSLCLQDAQTKAAKAATGPGADEQTFYRRAAAILLEIRNEVDGGAG